MKKLMCLALVLLLVLSMTACRQGQAPQGEPSQAAGSSQSLPETSEAEPEEERITVLGELAKLGPGEGNWLGLTPAQKGEDFDYLYQTLLENYPYFHVLRRMHGVDLAEEYEKYSALARESKSDAEFFVILDQFTRTAQMVGHLSAISPMEYPWFVEAYQNMENLPEEALAPMKKIGDAYGNAESVKSYEALGEIFWPVFDRVQEYYARQETGEDGGGEPEPEEEAFSNVVTEILEPGRVAYICIYSLDIGRYEADKELLFDFYGQVKDYEHVIFDFTMNGGGGMPYFDDLVVAPNIDRPLTTQVYELARDGAHNRRFLDFEDWEPIENLPDLPRMNAEDRAGLDLMLPSDYEVKPLTGQKMLNGRLWMLVIENVFSSSEYAAMFSKATGFATLVGSRTGGDGIGRDPLPVVLPNSHLIVRYSPVYGVTPDGVGSQEFGTQPDLESPEGETALETCLGAIEALDRGQ